MSQKKNRGGRREATRPEGLSDEAKAVRHHYLRCNTQRAIELASRSPYADPVVIFADPNDIHGRDFAQAVERAFRELGQECPFSMEKADKWGDRGTVPLFTIVVDFKMACEIMAISSPTAVASLNTPRPAGVFWAVCMAMGGNSYFGLPIRKEGIKIGHHRDREEVR